MTWCIQPEESSIGSSRTQPNTSVLLQITFKYSFLQNDLISLNFDLLNSYDLNVTEQCISINEIVCLSVPRVLNQCLGGQPQDSLRPQQINCFCSTRKWSDGIRRNAKWTEPGVNYEWETYFIGFHALLSSSTMPIHFSTNKDIIIFPFFSFELGDDANLGDLSCGTHCDTGRHLQLLVATPVIHRPLSPLLGQHCLADVPATILNSSWQVL